MSYTLQTSLADSLGSPQLSARKTVTPTNNTFMSGRKTVGNVEVEIALTVSPGNCMLLNRGATDILTVGYATGDYEIDIPPGESALLRPAAAKAVTSLFILSSGTADVENLDFMIRAA